jgi:exodeoxyribonuclease III
MKIVSWNVNGLRANYKKGFLSWFNKTKAGFYCLQEIRAKEEDLPEDLLNIKGFFSIFNPAQKLGYSGTAIYSKVKPKAVIKEVGFKKFDEQGRFLRADYKDFTLINLYIPHGGRSKEFLDYKLEAYNFLIAYLNNLKDKKVIVVGDFNIAHKEIDLARPNDNKNSIMFTPEERTKIDKIIGLGFIDSFRQFNKKGGNYTWWPYLYNARQRNLGWRIDYVFASKSVKIEKAFIESEIQGSDHCPVGIEIE